MSSTPLDVILAETWEGVSDATQRFIREVFVAGDDGVFTDAEKGRIAVRAMELLEGQDGHRVSVSRASAAMSLGRTMSHAGPDSDWFFRLISEFRRDMAGAQTVNPDPRQRIEALVISS